MGELNLLESADPLGVGFPVVSDIHVELLGKLQNKLCRPERMGGDQIYDEDVDEGVQLLLGHVPKKVVSLNVVGEVQFHEGIERRPDRAKSVAGGALEPFASGMQG